LERIPNGSRRFGANAPDRLQGFRTSHHNCFHTAKRVQELFGPMRSYAGQALQDVELDNAFSFWPFAAPHNDVHVVAPELVGGIDH
jgi:hypothetical protein